MRKLIAYAAVVVIAAALGAGFLLAAGEATTRIEAAVCAPLLSPAGKALAREAPDFELPDPQGRKVKLSSLRGKVVVLNFWASWCPPCVDEMPSMQALGRALAGRDALIVGVTYDENWDAVHRFFREQLKEKPAMKLLLDKNDESAVSRRYGTTKFPETYLIDRQGIVRYHIINKRDWASRQALACVESLLE